MNKAKVLTGVFFATLLVLSTGCEKLQSRDELNKGVQAYRAQKYADAAKHFKEAVRLDPTSENALSYLATSYMTQWVPGVDSPDNKKNHDMAVQTFQQLLDKDPKNNLALGSMAFMAYSSATNATPDQRTAALEEARKWNQRRVEVNPKDAEAYYYLGVIDWSEAFTPIQTVRVNQHMKPDDPGPIKDPKVREELKAKYQSAIDSGIQDLQKSVTLNKENDDAMTYLNLLLRKKADLEDSPEASRADISQAEEWFNKSLEMKKIKANRPAKKTEAA